MGRGLRLGNRLSWSLHMPRARAAVIGIGMDPCFGFLYVPRQGRLSLSYDILNFIGRT